MIAHITRAYVRHYSDNGQTVAYVDWIDTGGQPGRTEGEARPLDKHMAALFERARREGVEPTFERW